MGDFFANLHSGVQFPQVVMNQGPMPGTGGLPRPLHDSVDGRINYNSSLLGDLSPYAYGEPGYLSSQTAYLNIPHKLQKIVPTVYLPQAKAGTTEFFDLSHPVDDGDLAFVLRLDRQSLFCTGLKSKTQRAGLGTAIDPLVNLATVNYILSGLQLGLGGLDSHDLWRELLCNLDKNRFGSGKRVERCSFGDIVHIVRNCIRPFGVARGSERQGGQNEATASPAQWPVSFVVSVTMDGKESNVMNIWHNVGISAGEDLVLRLKPMPVLPYTLNHYYKGVKRQSWGGNGKTEYVWQLVPDLMHLDPPTVEDQAHIRQAVATLPAVLRPTLEPSVWQELGFWHIGRAQIMSGKYGVEEYWHNDMASDLRINHLDMTLQPVFVIPPKAPRVSPGGMRMGGPLAPADSHLAKKPRSDGWEPVLRLERLQRPPVAAGPSAPARRCVGLVPRPSVNSFRPLRVGVVASGPAPRPVAVVDDMRWDRELGLGTAAAGLSDDIGTLSFTFDDAPPAPVLPSKKGGRKKGAVVGGSLLRADGTSEASMVGML